MHDNRFGSTSCYAAYLLWQRSKMRNPSLERFSWFEPLVLGSESVGVITHLPCCGAHPLLLHLGGIFFSRIFRVSSRCSGLKRDREGLQHSSRVFREKPGTPLDPVFYGISAERGKVPGLRRSDFPKLHHLASSWTRLA